MSASNSVHIMGRLTADPELKSTQSGVFYTRITVAVNRDRKDQNGEYKADFINVTAWRQTAEFISRYFSKGRMIAVEGTLQTGSYKDRQYPDVTHYTTEILASSAAFCGDKPTEGSNQGRNAQTSQGANPQNNMDLSDFEEVISDGDLPF